MATNNVSHTKIVSLLVGICLLLFIGLIAYRQLNQSKPAPIVATQFGTVFPQPRDIKSFELVSAEGTLFNEKDFLQHWSLIIFGFTHCAKICPTTLALLQKTYPALKEKIPNLQIIFVSLDPERDKPEVIKAYLKKYNSDFIGASGQLAHLHKLQSQLGIYSERKGDAANYQIQHTTSILLINPEGKWAGSIPFGLTATQFMAAVKSAVLDN